MVGLVGAPIGLLWAAITPRAELAATDSGGLRLVDVEDKAFIATDGTFFLLTLGVGLLVGVLAWFLGRRWAVGTVLGIVLGGVLGAYVALKAGQVFDGRLGSFTDRTRSAADGVPLTLPNELLEDSRHSWHLLLAMPAGAAVTFAVLAYLRIGPPPPRTSVPIPTVPTGPGVSWGSPEPARSPGWGPPAGPAAGQPPASAG